MRKRIFNWQGQRFIYLNIEGELGHSPIEQSRRLFDRASSELTTHGFSLMSNTVRTRIIGRTIEARAAGSAARIEALKGASRASGSSYISRSHFASAADVALDLLAMAQPSGGESRQVTEQEPKQAFIRHLVWGPMIFFPGMTSELPSLTEQYGDILRRAHDLLEECNCLWDNVVGMSCFLHTGVDPEGLLLGLHKSIPLCLKNAEIEFVEGFSKPCKLIELEFTAKAGGHEYLVSR